MGITLPFIVYLTISIGCYLLSKPNHPTGATRLKWNNTGGADGDRTRVQTNALLLSTTAIKFKEHFKEDRVETRSVFMILAYNQHRP